MENQNETVATAEAQQTATPQAQEQQVQGENNNMLLGKFKSVDALTNAYKNMESHLGQQSKEIGVLREKAQMLDNFLKNNEQKEKMSKVVKDYLENALGKYKKDEYFNNSEFTDLFKEAFMMIGPNLDIDKFVSMLDKYTAARISLNDKQKAAQKETENAKSQMQFSDSATKKNQESVLNLDKLTPEEIDAYVAKHI